MNTFYYYFRPLAIVGKIFGSFPIENAFSLNPEKLVYKRLSFSFIYSFSVQYALLVLIGFFSGFEFQDNTLTLKVLKYVVFFMIGRSLISFTYSLFMQAKRMPRLIQLLDSFDEKKQYQLVQGNAWGAWKKVSVTIVLPMLFFLHFSVLYAWASRDLIKEIFPPSHSTKGFLLTAADYFGILTCWHILPSLYYIIFSTTISRGYRQINKTLISSRCFGDYYNIGAQVKFDSCMDQVIVDLRILHNMLSEATVQLSKCYGSFLAIEKIFICVAVVVNISCYIFEAHHFTHLITLTSLNVIVAIITVRVSEQLKRRVSIFNGKLMVYIPIYFDSPNIQELDH
ncbi:hypothetical protein GWI33_016322 [Rhynchophorus ferrugineus]|uniref:Gustatory receptor n=1 Tax=Rhynchophorus ferrugineus TaxID=354439 RepID=A0A834HY90_RHYFE|nr:hypothetical protein GWI33_016322 [Rhynchophorus ferrugineus]